MAFSIELYNMTSEPNKVGKDKTLLTTLEGELKEETSLLNPVITIASNTVPQGNYCRIEAFGRYYFITDVVCKRKSLWEIHLKVDVLDTYIDQIKTNTAILARSEKFFNMYLKDDRIGLSQKRFSVTKTFTQGSGTNTGFYFNSDILMTVGHVREEES